MLDANHYVLIRELVQAIEHLTKALNNNTRVRLAESFDEVLALYRPDEVDQLIEDLNGPSDDGPLPFASIR